MKLRQFGLVAFLGVSTICLLGCPSGSPAPDETNQDSDDTTTDDDTATDDGSADDTSGGEANGDCADGDVADIRGCECFWEAQITGDFNDTFSGTFAAFTLIPGQSGPALAFEFQEFTGATGDSASTFPTGGDDPDGDSTGVFEVAMFLSDGPNFFSGGGEATEVYLDITSNSGGSIEGTITGTLEGADPDDPTAGREVQVTLTFRASENTILNVPCSGTAP
jgi:hypothetical protein